jgi:type II secretory pathway component PulF
MPFIVTPGQLIQRSELYHQLGTLISAGISLPQALETMQRNPPSRSFREPLRQLNSHLSNGCTFTVAVERLGNWIPSFDLALVQAGEQSGRLDACFKLLAIYYRERAQMARQVISDLLYPVFVFHFAIFLFPFIQFFQDGNLAWYLAQTFGILIPIYAAVFFLIFACQGRHGEKWRSATENVLYKIPLLGTARRQLALARLSAALEALINAGVSILGGWELAATASGSPALRRAVVRWQPLLQTGETPGDLLATTREFPEMFANLYRTGEISGKLDETLLRLHAHYQEEGTRKLRAFSQWTPRLVYAGVAIMVAIRVISFYAGYFNQVNEVMKGF